MKPARLDRELVAEIAQLVGAREARWIVEHGGSRRTVDDLVRRRMAGEPLQYVLGRWQFRELELEVGPAALIPRPETEVVAGLALREMARLAGSRDELVVADLGTGTGAIALSVAVEGAQLPGVRQLRVLATDVSTGALALAARNAADVLGTHDGFPPVAFFEGSWYEALPAELANRLSVVVSNPPYVSEGEWQELDPEVRDHEPHDALVSGPTGLEDLEEIVGGAPLWLSPGGALVAEIAPHQAVAAQALAEGAGLVPEVLPDLAGRLRCLVARAL
jgi:release factor glutamine methyltransferase